MGSQLPSLCPEPQEPASIIRQGAGAVQGLLQGLYDCPEGVGRL